MKKADSDIVIDMKPNSNGVFEGGCVRTVRKKSAKEDVRPDKTLKKSRPPKLATARVNARRGRRKEPVKSAVPNPVSDLQEGVQAGLDILSGISSVARLFR